MATRARGGQVFEDFKPISEWKQSDDEESHNLIIYLSGFTKDQIRVSTEGRNTIRVRGERLATGNKWSRFVEDFQVPENSEMNSIRAKLQGGILYITVPKKSVITKQPQEGITQPPTPKQTTPQKDQGREHAATDKTTLKTQKPSDNKNDVGNDDSERRKRSDDELLKEKHTPQERGDNIIKMMELKTKDEANEEDKAVSKGKQVKESRPSDYGAAFAVGRRYKEALEGIADLSDDRQLLVNIGVAVLVIVGISAYATYKFCFIRKR